MYIFELIYKLFQNKEIEEPENEITLGLENVGSELPDSETCEHMYMPIDSTGETLACAKCGNLIKRSQLEKIQEHTNNPFS